MDPALEEAIRVGPPDRELEAAVLAAGRGLPSALRVVARLGDVVTGRVRVEDVREVRRSRAVASLKLGRTVAASEAAWAPPPAGGVDRGVEGADGRGCVLAFLDWGCDLAHPAFLRADGSTRLRALWDQRGPGDANRYGYGRIAGRAAIDAALRTGDPYAALGYRLGERPAHGTHVMSIAAGSGAAATPRGIAPGAELVFVHLATGQRPGDGDLGDSVRVLEALAFARDEAGDDPLVVNMSLGRTAGEHTGRSLVERAIDAFVEERPGRAVVQSCGNYHGKQLHADGLLRPGGAAALGWDVEAGDPTTNELEVWYPGVDRLRVELAAPGGAVAAVARQGESAPVAVGGRAVGFAYHRPHDPLNGDHHVDVFLEPAAPAGRWEVRLVAEDVVDGRWNAWIERDGNAPGAQSRLAPGSASDRATIGTIATGRRSLVVGAWDPRAGRPAPFSSAGPTRDGRPKPDLVAPGVAVVAARSTPPGEAPGGAGTVAMSGTSMAAPHVAGTVALLFGEAPRKLNIAETRLLILGSALPLGTDVMRTGAGLLDTEAALAALRCMFERREQAMSREQGSSWASWSDAGEDVERELDAILGAVEDYDVVGWAGGPLRAPVRPGDVIVRADGGGRGRPLVARVVGPELRQASATGDGEAEPEGDGYYGEAVQMLRTGYAAAPAYRLVTDRNGIVRPRQVVLRPVVPVRPPFMALRGPRIEPLARVPWSGPRAVVPMPVVAPTAQPASGAPAGASAADLPPEPEPPAATPEPSPDDGLGLDGPAAPDARAEPEDREDAGRPRPKVTKLEFPEEPVVVPVTTYDGGDAAAEVDALVEAMADALTKTASAYLTGVDHFVTNLQFASDQEAQPRYFEAALSELAKQAIDAVLKHALEKVPVVGEIVGAVKGVAVKLYERSEQASEARGQRRIAEYVEDARNVIERTGAAMTVELRSVVRPRLHAALRDALARSAPGQGRTAPADRGRLVGDAAVMLTQIREVAASFVRAVPDPERIHQLLAERFAGPEDWTSPYANRDRRRTATLYLTAEVTFDRSGSLTTWTMGPVSSAWTLVSLSPHPDRLATSLKNALKRQRLEVWRTSLPKMVHLKVYEEVWGLNPLHDGYVRFFADPAVFEIRSNYGLAEFDAAWRVPGVRAAALRVNELAGASS